MNGEPMSGDALQRRRHLDFTMIVGGTPPTRTRTTNSPFGGVWEAVVDNLVIDKDTGYSSWAKITLADRLEARRAVISLRHYVARMAYQFRIEIRYDDAEFAFWVRKVGYYNG